MTAFLYRCECGRNLHPDDATKDATRMAYVFHCFSCNRATLIDADRFERRMLTPFRKVFEIPWTGRFEVLPRGVT